MSFKTEDWQENMMAAKSDGMISPIQESATSIQTIMFCDDVVRVSIRQEGQLILIVDNTRYGDAHQNQQQEQQHTMAGVSTIVNGKKDYEEMPDLFFEESEETLE